MLAADFVGSFALLGDDLLPRLLVTLTAILVPLQTAFAAHLLLVLPDRTRSGPVGRRLVAAALRAGWPRGCVVDVHALRLTCPGCARTFTVIDVPGAAHRAHRGVRGGVGAAQCAASSSCRSFATAAPAAGSVACCGCRTSRSGGRGTVRRAVPGRRLQGDRCLGRVQEALIAFEVVALLGVPMCFLIGLLNERLSYKRIGELVVRLAGDGDADLERSLAVALGDPQLTVAFPVVDGYVDTQGRPVPRPEPDDRTTVTAVGEREAPMALIRHDRSLNEEPALLTAAGSAIRLILENARLQAEVRAAAAGGPGVADPDRDRHERGPRPAGARPARRRPAAAAGHRHRAAAAAAATR